MNVIEFANRYQNYLTQLEDVVRPELLPLYRKVERTRPSRHGESRTLFQQRGGGGGCGVQAVPAADGVVRLEAFVKYNWAPAIEGRGFGRKSSVDIREMLEFKGGVTFDFLGSRWARS